MRILPILTAILVTLSLYMFVFEREALVAFASGEAPAASEADEAPAENRKVSVVAFKSRAEQIDSVVVVRGQTEAARQVDVRAETSGQVISDPIRKGAAVEAGQLLCEIDPAARGAALAAAEAGLVDAEIAYRSTEQLVEGGFAKAARGEAAKATLQSARAAVEAAEKEIDRFSIRAPFEGLLESDTAEVGSFLQPGGLCATVIQLDPIKLVGFVPETEVSRVAIGSFGGAQLISGERIAGTVTFLSRSADPETRTFRVELEVPNPDLSIRDGQTVEIAIGAEGRVAHLLPQSALTLNDAGALGVRVVGEDARAHFKPVDLLRDTPEGVYVSGLGEEADVIVVGQEFVSEGVPVAPTYRDALE